MNGQRLDATILQLFSQLGDDELLVVPAEARLHRDGQADRLHHLLRHLQQLRNVLQHTRPGTLPGHLLHRTAEVQVDEVRSRLLHNLRRLDHRLHVAPVNLYAHGPLLVTDGQLADSRLHIAHQRLCRDKLRINHRRPEPLTQHPEAQIGHILHGSQKQWALTKLNIPYLHNNLFSIYRIFD